jgi:hypothetical protein
VDFVTSQSQRREDSFFSAAKSAPKRDALFSLSFGGASQVPFVRDGSGVAVLVQRAIAIPNRRDHYSHYDCTRQYSNVIETGI